MFKIDTVPFSVLKSACKVNSADMYTVILGESVILGENLYYLIRDDLWALGNPVIPLNVTVNFSEVMPN